MIRQIFAATALAGALVVGAALAATASTTAGADAPQGTASQPAASSAAATSRAATSAAAASRRDGPPGPAVRLTGAALAAAADRCAQWAADAGFENDGYLAGSLTTAVAVALAESNCQPSACFDNTTGHFCQEPGPSGDSVDRGAWQLNSKQLHTISNHCAYTGPCSARAAYNPLSYNPVSDFGSYFDLWATYRSNAFTSDIPAAQQAVNTLTSGTVTSGLDGSCLGYPRDAANAAAILENCGSGAADQIWKIKGSTLRTSRGLCLAARSAGSSGTAVLRRCNGSSLQNWLAHGDASLQDSGARRCLTDPGGSDKPGAVIGDARCNGGRAQTWYRP